MRVAESINVVFFAFLLVLAMVGWPARRRLRIIAIGALAIGPIVAVQFLPRFLAPLSASVVRDWLPAPILLMAYWQVGQFFTKPNEKLQTKLQRFDERLFEVFRRLPWPSRARGWIRTYLELAYLLCYLLVPFGLGLLYLMHMRRYAEEFWAVVLPPTYLCYGMVPLLPTLPPRALAGESSLSLPSTKLRVLNLWVLRHASIQANTFPSAHVAASVAVALELLRRAPWAGAAYLWVAISIALGAVAGRYHYAADAILGAGLALTGFLVASRAFV